MQLSQPSPDALVSFSDFVLERFGLAATMQVALVLSVAFHAFIVVGLGIRFLPDPRWDAPHNILEVVLVNSKTQAKPDKADVLAQANLAGGGNTDQKARASSPLPNLEQKRQQEELRETEARRRQLEAEARELMTRMKAKAQVVPVESPAQQAAKADLEARDLVDKSLEIARLEAQIRRDFIAYQERPKRKFIGARAEEYRFATYVDNWRQKVERVGNLNYPAEARARKIYGSLLLTVAIKADGEVETVAVERSSGHKILDQAAIRIVRLSAPFERFPDAIRRDTDIIHITRTWTFTRGDQVIAE
jgi:protein TonB